jgi:AraC-like DNA-binding protein
LNVVSGGSWPLGLASAPAKEGDKVYAVTAVAGSGETVVTKMRVSSLLPMEGGKALELSVPVNPNDAGGPVIDAHGRVVGMVVTMHKFTGKSVAIPLEWIQAIRTAPRVAMAGLETLDLILRAATFALASAAAVAILLRRERHAASGTRPSRLRVSARSWSASATGVYATLGIAAFRLQRLVPRHASRGLHARAHAVRRGRAPLGPHLVAAGMLVALTMAGDYGRFHIGPLGEEPHIARGLLIAGRRASRSGFWGSLRACDRALARRPGRAAPARARGLRRGDRVGIRRVGDLRALFRRTRYAARGARLRARCVARARLRPAAIRRARRHRGALAGAAAALRARRARGGPDGHGRERARAARDRGDGRRTPVEARGARHRRSSRARWEPGIPPAAARSTATWAIATSTTSCTSTGCAKPAERLSRLEEAHLPVLTIALDCGYGSIGPFNRAFKTRFGVTPTQVSAATTSYPRRWESSRRKHDPAPRLGRYRTRVRRAPPHSPSRADAAGPWPTKPVRIMVGASPGGGTDIIARMLGDKLARSSASPSWSRTARAPPTPSPPT